MHLKTKGFVSQDPFVAPLLALIYPIWRILKP